MAQDAHDVANPGAAGLTSQGLDGLRRALVADVEHRRLPGAIAVITRGGVTGCFEVLGHRDAARGTPMEANSIFRIFSMTKPIVSVGIMMLVEQGRIIIGEPIAKYLPEFAEQKVLVPRGEDYDLVPAERATTVQDLLRHTSGLTYDFVASGPIKQLYTDATLHRRDQTNAEFCRVLAGLPLMCQPGSRWSYSHATDVLGRLIEVVSGQSLAEFLAARILGPLGMNDTAFSVAPANHDRIVEPFAKDPDTGTDVALYNPRENPQLQSGGGGLLSTAGDYMRFVEMLAGSGTRQGTRILGRKTLEFMTADHLEPDIAIEQALGLLPPAHGFGLGFAVRRSTGIASFPSSPGTYFWGGIAGTVFWVDPKEDLTALLMIQAPGQRAYYRMLFRNLVYAALA